MKYFAIFMLMLGLTACEDVNEYFADEPEVEIETVEEVPAEE